MPPNPDVAPIRTVGITKPSNEFSRRSLDKFRPGGLMIGQYPGLRNDISRFKGHHCFWVSDRRS